MPAQKKSRKVENKGRKKWVRPSSWFIGDKVEEARLRAIVSAIFMSHTVGSERGGGRWCGGGEGEARLASLVVAGRLH